MKNESHSKKPVWIIISGFHPILGGDELIAKYFASKLTIDHNWPVRVLTRRHGARRHNLPSSELVDGVPVVRVWSKGKIIGSILYLLGGIWQLARHGSGGIYHAYDLKMSTWIATIAKFLFGGRSIIKLRSGVYYYKNIFPSLFSFSSTLSRMYFTLPLRSADCILVVSNEVRDFLLDMGISPEQIALIPNAVNTKRFFPATPLTNKLKIREKLNIPGNKTVFLYTGRLQAIKGIDILLRGWKNGQKLINEELVLVLVGDHSEIVDEINDDPVLAKSIIMTGIQKNVVDYYQAADIFIIASRTEGLSVSLLEAMACGLPVIASNVGGTPDVVHHNENGLLFESENVNQLAKHISKMLEMREKWDQIGKHNRQTILEYADLDVCTRKISELYQNLSYNL
jgi:glycosyltransferase involved in cell wall biosynthesis